MKSYYLFLLFIFTVSGQTYCQNKYFFPVYPIGDNPSVGYLSSLVPDKENIYFEAKPILRMSLFNNIQQRFMNDEKDYASALYLSFRPQLRMYTDHSKPVKTPSYKIGILGYQRIYRLRTDSEYAQHFLAFAIESGHYSNGQTGCAFSRQLEDGSTECIEAYSLIDTNTNLSDLLNRESGNFSTNYSEVIFKYFYIPVYDDNYIPKLRISFQIGYNRYHNNLLWVADIGGYSEEDIDIYGRNRIFFGVDGFYKLDPNRLPSWLRILDRMAHSIDYQFISKPHESVNPHRLVVQNTLYFKNHVGIFVAAIYGHDSYNYRFVDSGFQFSAGLTFDAFPPIQLVH